MPEKGICFKSHISTRIKKDNNKKRIKRSETVPVAVSKWLEAWRKELLRQLGHENTDSMKFISG
jgi:hypothetical protein